MLSDHQGRGKNAGHIMGSDASLKHLIPASQRNRPESFFVPELGPVVEVFITTPDIIDQDIQATLVRLDTLKQGSYFFVVHMVATDGDGFPALCGHFFCSLTYRPRQLDRCLTFFYGPARQINGGSSFTQFQSDALSDAATRAC